MVSPLVSSSRPRSSTCSVADDDEEPTFLRSKDVLVDFLRYQHITCLSLSFLYACICLFLLYILSILIFFLSHILSYHTHSHQHMDHSFLFPISFRSCQPFILVRIVLNRSFYIPRFFFFPFSVSLLVNHRPVFDPFLLDLMFPRPWTILLFSSLFYDFPIFFLFHLANCSCALDYRYRFSWAVVCSCH